MRPKPNFNDPQDFHGPKFQDLFRFHDVSKNKDGQFGKRPAAHWWDTPAIVDHPSQYNFFYPEIGNYDDSNINRKLIDSHANTLTQAGVDFIGVDLSNGNQQDIWDSFEAVCLRYTERVSAKKPFPKVTAFVRGSAGIEKFRDDLWKNNKFSKEIYFYYQGRPVIFVADSPKEAPVKDETYPELHVIRMWGLLADVTERWSYKQNVEPGQNQGFFEYNGWPEQSSLAATTQQTLMFHSDYEAELKDNPDKRSNELDQYRMRKGRKINQNGPDMSYWNQQWDYIDRTNPSFIFIWGWNEWVSQNTYRGEQPENGPVKGRFVDMFGIEYAHDIEPSKTLGSVYYDSMKRQIASYKRNTPNFYTRDPQTGIWKFKFFREDFPGANSSLKRNFTGEFKWVAGNHYQPFVADLNMDGRTDIGMRDPNNGIWYFAYRNASGFSFSNTDNFEWKKGESYQAVVGDFNGDKVTDLALRNLEDGSWEILHKTQDDFNADKKLTVAWPAGRGENFEAMAGDFNNDSFYDIILRDKNTGTFFFRNNDQRGSFSRSSAKTDWANGNNFDPFVVDADQDGNLDIGLLDRISGRIFLRNGIGEGKFPNQDEFLLFDSSSHLVMVD